MDILDEIAQKTRERLVLCKELKTLEQVKEEALAMDCNTGFPFEEALKKKGVSFICEVKKASPSKGVIAKEFPYVEIAKMYEEAGASAISGRKSVFDRDSRCCNASAFAKRFYGR